MASPRFPCHLIVPEKQAFASMIIRQKVTIGFLNKSAGIMQIVYELCIKYNLALKTHKGDRKFNWASTAAEHPPGGAP